MSSPILSTLARSRPLWGQVCQQYGRTSNSAGRAAFSSASNEKAASAVYQRVVKDDTPWILVGALIGTVGSYFIGGFYNREASRTDKSISDLKQEIYEMRIHINARIDDKAKTLDACIDRTNARIDDKAKTLDACIDRTNARIDDRAATLNARIDDKAATLNARIDRVHDRIDNLRR